MMKPESAIVIENLIIQDTDIEKAEHILIDNGIEPDEASIVLEAIGYALLGAELYKGD